MLGKTRFRKILLEKAGLIGRTYLRDHYLFKYIFDIIQLESSWVTYAVNLCSGGMRNRPRLNSSRQIFPIYEGWNFNSGNYLFTTDTK